MKLEHHKHWVNILKRNIEQEERKKMELSETQFRYVKSSVEKHMNREYFGSGKIDKQWVWNAMNRYVWFERLTKIYKHFKGNKKDIEFVFQTMSGTGSFRYRHLEWSAWKQLGLIYALNEIEGKSDKYVERLLLLQEV